MSLFEFENRTCPKCGAPFRALTIWSRDSVCGRCSQAKYQARLDAINASRSYTVASIGGACPTQATGRTPDDRPFYFRARHGEWSLEVGRADWPTDYVEWPDDKYEQPYTAAGPDQSHGFMSDDEVLAVLDAHLPKTVAS